MKQTKYAPTHMQRHANEHRKGPPLQPRLHPGQGRLCWPLNVRPDLANRLPDVTDIDDRQALADLRRHFPGVFLVLRRQQDRLDAGAVCSNKLLFDSTDALDVTRQLEFSLYNELVLKHLQSKSK